MCANIYHGAHFPTADFLVRVARNFVGGQSRCNPAVVSLVMHSSWGPALGVEKPETTDWSPCDRENSSLSPTADSYCQRSSSNLKIT